MDIKTAFFLLLCSCVASTTAFGQHKNDDEANPDSLNSALVPAVGYSSNQGLAGGLMFSRHDNTGDIEPFKSYLKGSALVSTKGYVEVEGEYERTQNFGRPVRSILDVFFNRYTTDNFFGVGNDIPFDQEKWENEYYYFESVGWGVSYDLRKLIYESGEEGYLDLVAGVETEYQIPYVKKTVSSFGQQQPNGSRGGWLNFLKTGFIWENRDHEFDPQKGNRLALELRYAPELVSRYAMGTARLEMRQYFRLFNQITVANFFEARHAMGDIPYWELSTLADNNTLRGYALNRFQGNSSMAYTLELRSWIIEYPEFYRLKLGMQLFTDTGRVFTAEDNIDDLFRGYKQTIGVGGALSIINSDFILRGEIGFSDEVSRIYVGVGYLF